MNASTPVVPEPHVSDATPGEADNPTLRRYRRMLSLLLARYTLRHLVRLYAAFEGDLLLPIVLGEVGLYNVSGMDVDEAARGQFRCGCDEDFRKLVLRPCNAFSISSSTGIPRETVRRKVARLAELGWIVRDSRGGLTITAKAAAECLQPFDRENLADFLNTAERLRTLLTAEIKA
ncbi:MAG TPA: hypothetical protein PLN96_12450 [Zoogloea sp.]|uniref:hypothetical protein n=1 Tax=Zoogloea sp. TaxID=49181 RepID=UPI002CFC6ECF|nr:hypothetical protein [Zoogloea sp.]HMV17361.1 hypothetical protein [Rhodocyclaceae bacterium]HMV64909.1 hypothetical protein [Rhodocyclaceae bacterium]HMW51869.1 hypothetical protein [Rhodocyclaceae bacterium]HMY49420.1 hypothetical protein [Rhodocyclaceae bacterium]HMZ76913.1 hypothetical protein [Rhodocyclaceae bacterium]